MAAHARNHGRRGPCDSDRAEPKKCTGNFFIDEDVLRAEGTEDFESYAVEPGHDLFPDFFV